MISLRRKSRKHSDKLCKLSTFPHSLSWRINLKRWEETSSLETSLQSQTVAWWVESQTYSTIQPWQQDSHRFFATSRNCRSIYDDSEEHSKWGLMQDSRHIQNPNLSTSVHLEEQTLSDSCFTKLILNSTTLQSIKKCGHIARLLEHLENSVAFQYWHSKERRWAKHKQF